MELEENEGFRLSGLVYIIYYLYNLALALIRRIRFIHTLWMKRGPCTEILCVDTDIQYDCCKVQTLSQLYQTCFLHKNILKWIKHPVFPLLFKPTQWTEVKQTTKGNEIYLLTESDPVLSRGFREWDCFHVWLACCHRNKQGDNHIRGSFIPPLKLTFTIIETFMFYTISHITVLHVQKLTVTHINLVVSFWNRSYSRPALWLRLYEQSRCVLLWFDSHNEQMKSSFCLQQLSAKCFFFVILQSFGYGWLRLVFVPNPWCLIQSSCHFWMLFCTVYIYTFADMCTHSLSHTHTYTHTHTVCQSQ